MRTIASFFTHLSPLGLEVIRAFRRQDLVRRTLEGRMDRNTAPMFLNLVLNRWLAVRLELLGALIALGAATAVVLQRSVSSPGTCPLMEAHCVYAI